MRIICVILLLCLGGCTRAGFTVLNMPVAVDKKAVFRDIAYGPQPEQKLDIYVPNNLGTAPHGVVVFFYGGRWTTGSKNDYQFVAASLADRGFVVVIPDYRKYPQVRFPVFVQDGAKALAWVSDNIGTYHGSNTRISVVGHSAGAHIGALLAADASYLSAEGKNRSDVIRSFVGLAGPYDFVPDEPDLEDMFGPPNQYPLMQVPTFIDGKQPPMLLLHGNNDVTVKSYNLEKLKNKINTAGGLVKTRIYKNTDHIDILLGFSWLKSTDAPVINDFMYFINEINSRI